MSKAFAIGIAALIVALFVGGAYAVSQGTQNNGQSSTKGQYHDQMQSILEDGTYDDLVALREETGRNMMPMVTDETSFAAMQEHHKQMEELYGEDAGMMGKAKDGKMHGMMGKAKDKDGVFGWMHGKRGSNGKAGQHGKAIGCPFLSDAAN